MSNQMQQFPSRPQPQHIQAGNPLSKFFRQPAIYFALPSGGTWWAQGALQPTETGEVAVYPMTTKDEIMMRTPDALINGQGMVEIIQSCIPNIKDAWKMPAVDVDAVLIAMRIASYGHMMDFETQCPHCNEEHTYSLDLRVLLASISSPDFDQLFESDELLIKFRPQAYFGVNKANKVAFEIQKLDQAIGSIEDNDAKAAEAVAQMKRLVELNLEILTECTEWIAIKGAEDQRIYDKAYLLEFYRNTNSRMVDNIRDQYQEISSAGAVPPQKTTCAGCAESMDMAITFDYANFFANGS